MGAPNQGMPREEAFRDEAHRVAWQQRAGLVEPTGIEPVTFWLQTRRSPS